jgi:sterol desaturase/sphingolipid hydroxylase (fatty acid hydroxylase superfamily)
VPIEMIHLVVPVITYDIWFYISHVLLHKYLYKFHKIHHLKEEITWKDTYVGHWMESPFQGIGMFFPYLLCKYTWLDTFLILVFLNVRGMMRHDSRFIWLVGNHHVLHHRFQGYNYGNYWIDYLCGTQYPRLKAYRCGLLGRG